MRMVIASVAVLLIAAPGAAEVRKSADADAKIVCKYKAKTGTRFPSKKCHSVKEWEQITEEHRRTAAEMSGPVVQIDPEDPGGPKN